MAVETKHNLVSLKRQLCLGNNDTNFIAKSKQIIEVVKKIVYKAVATPSHYKAVATPSHFPGICTWHQRILFVGFAAADESHCEKASLGVGPLVLLDCAT